MKVNIITIFPQIFDSYFSESIIKRAQEKNIVQINTINLRNFTNDKHKTVDDTPYGGGAGMLLKIEPLYKAIQNSAKQTKIILLSAKGKKWNQQMAKKYSKLNNITLICGRYEGVDERITDFIDEEISIGDYVLTGGELGAMIIIDSIIRLLPKVLGNANSIISESHSEKNFLEYPQYTKPAIFIDNLGKKHKVPNVLLSGNHKKIKEWKNKNSYLINKK